MSCIEKLPYSNSVKDKLNILVKLLLDSGIDCSMIVLFGSYARMEQKAGSDLDILVLTSSEVPREVRGELCSKFEELGADLVFYEEGIFNSSDALLVQKVRREGILLWKR